MVLYGGGTYYITMRGSELKKGMVKNEVTSY
jgi:hypothetical protein